jgi:hypothetical protein
VIEYVKTHRQRHLLSYQLKRSLIVIKQIMDVVEDMSLECLIGERERDSFQSLVIHIQERPVNVVMIILILMNVDNITLSIK